MHESSTSTHQTSEASRPPKQEKPHSQESPFAEKGQNILKSLRELSLAEDKKKVVKQLLFQLHPDRMISVQDEDSLKKYAKELKIAEGYFKRVNELK